MKNIFLSSDWGTATIKDIKEYLRFIEALDKDKYIISSRLGDYEQTTNYLKKRIDEK